MYGIVVRKELFDIWQKDGTQSGFRPFCALMSFL